MPDGGWWLLGAGLFVALWHDAARARERAVTLGRDLCAARGLQLLDETVALASVGAGRDPSGRLRLRRRFRFEFTRDGAARDTGTIVRLGAWMESADLPLEDHRSYEHGEH